MFTPKKKISSLTQLHKVYAGTSEERTATFKVTSTLCGSMISLRQKLRYLGIQDQDDGTPNHYYLIAGEHRVCVDQIEDFEQVS